MTLFTEKDANKLIESSQKTNISIFVPTYRANRDEENRIGLKNAIKEVEQTLEEHGWEEEKIDTCMKPIYELLKKENFWNYQSDGLAIYRNNDVFEYYTVPVHFDNFTFVGEDFYIKPMLNLLDNKGTQFLMAVSPNQVRLLRFTDFSIEEYDLSGDFPKNMEESKWHIDENATLQSHSANNNLFHGQGGGKDSKEEDIRRYFRDVNTGLEDFFRGRKESLYLAGVDSTVQIFKDVFKYNHMTDEHISGNHDTTSMLELHSRAMEIVQSERTEELKNDINNLTDILHTDRTETDIEEIVKASRMHKIDTLYIRKDQKEWGYVSKNKDHVKLTEEKTNGQVDLLNTLAIKSLQSGAKVKIIESELLPENVNSTAIAYYRH